VLALGKAAPEMARGAVDALAEAGIVPAGGLIVAAHRPSEPAPLPLRVGDHPVPDIGSLAAADAIATAVGAVAPGDDVLVLISGGTTSLCAAPCAELVARYGHPAPAQAAIANAVQVMLDGGLAIHDMNAIRRRLLRWGGGRLATALHARGARMVRVLAISDVLGDDPAVIGSGPCTAESLDHEMLLTLCDAHGLRSTLEIDLARVLGMSGSPSGVIAPPTASHPAFARVHTEIVARNADAVAAVVRAATAEGVANVEAPPEVLEGDAEQLGRAIVHATMRRARHDDREYLVVWGGEPTMRLTDAARVLGDPDDHAHANDRAQHETPLGGRMQALALTAAVELHAASWTERPVASRISVLATSTDGRDGPTDAAGALIDVETALRAQRGGRDPVRDLYRFRSHRALDAAGALLRTGPSGTNVMDVVVVHIAPC
jgi:glycerate 2-kinase